MTYFPSTYNRNEDRILRDISNELKKGKTPLLSHIYDIPRVKSLSMLASLWHSTDRLFHQERLSALAQAASRILRAQPRVHPAIAADNLNLAHAKLLLKNIRSHKVDSPEIQGLQKQITSMKVGVSSKALDCNPGLQSFVEKYYIDRYLIGYDDSLKENAQTHEILIRKKGSFRPWIEVFSEIQQWPPRLYQPKEPWVYGPKGIQNKDMYNWTELKPFKKENPANWQHQYIFEFCACYNPRSIKTGNHSWMRLKTPSGDIYSVGLYRPGKTDWTDNFRKPMRVKPGYLMQPDVSEFWPYQIFSIEIAITEKDFLTMKKVIEEDKEQEDQIFQLFNNNCLLYCKKIARLAGIELPTSETVLQILTPPKLYRRVKQFIGYLPTIIQKIIHLTATFFLNLLQVALGGCSIDANLNDKQRERAVPHLKSAWDLLDSNKLVMNHPSTLSFKTLPWVQAWRRKKLEKLNKNQNDNPFLEKNSRKILFSLPPQHKNQSVGF